MYNVGTLADIPVWLKQVVFSGEINFCDARLRPIRIWWNRLMNLLTPFPIIYKNKDSSKYLFVLSLHAAYYYLGLKILNAPLQRTDRVSNEPPNYTRLHTKLWNWFEKLFLPYYESNHIGLSTFVQPLVYRLDHLVSHADEEWYTQLLVDYHPIPKADPIKIHIIIFY